MAVQNLVAQHLVFISTSNTFDVNIVNNANIVLIANNSVNKTYIVNMGTSYQIGGAAVAPLGGYMELIFYVTPAYQTTIQGNMPTIIAAFPSYQVITYGENIAYGN